MARDPAIVEAQELWRTDRKEAMLVLVRRISELNAEIQGFSAAVSAPTTPKPRGLLLKFVAVAVIASLITIAAGLVIAASAGVFQQEGDTTYDPVVQEWWSYSAPDADEFMSSIRAAVIFPLAGAHNEEHFDLVLMNHMLEASEYQDQFEQAEYPYAAKDIRDNISRGMTEYKLFVYGIDDDLDLGLSAGEFSEETIQYLEDGQAHMREAVQQIKKLTGEDASFLVMEDAE